MKQMMNKQAFFVSMGAFVGFFVGAHVAFDKLTPLVHNSLSASSDKCWWTFDKYMPSAYETQFDAATTEHDREPCKRLSRPVADSLDQYWKEYHKVTLCTSHESCPPITREKQQLTEKPSPPPEMSRFRYKKMCGSVVGKALYHPAPVDGPAFYDVMIEPLVGALRHPLYCFDQSYLLNKEYMIYSDPWLVQLSSQTNYPIRFLYYDAGASTWNSGAGGASQGWIIPEFTNRWCLQNAGIWAWEAITHSAEAIFGLLPPCLPPVYHWFNIKVSRDHNNSANIWRHLEATAKPEDFVVIKVDIDTPQVENPLMDEFAALSHLHLLVDEMFFEYHCDYLPPCAPWAACNNPSFPSYKNALKLFSTIRRGGVRIHSWV